MEEKSRMKTLLKVAIIIIAIILILAIIGLGSIFLKTKKSSTEKNIAKTEEKEIKSYNENNEICTIKGNGSNLLYKNEYESDLSYIEKIIYIDNDAKNNMTSSFVKMDVNQVLNIGAFKGEFVKIGYDINQYDYGMSLVYIEENEFYNCKTNKSIAKAINKNGKEAELPIINFDEETENIIPSDIKKVYALFDITTEDKEDYIIGMYNEIFSEENKNILSITTVLKKENVQIDVNDEEQVEKFWRKYADYEIEEINEEEQNNYEEVEIEGKTYYHRLNENKWQGEYHQDIYRTAESNNIRQVISYENYVKYIEEINNNIDEKISNHYTDNKSNYIILSYANGSSWCEMEIIDCIEENSKIIIYGDEKINGVMANGSGYFIAIPTNMPVGTEIEYIECYSTSEISDFKNYGTPKVEYMLDKPIIYLYPTEDTKVNVKLVNVDLATCLYPKYDYKNGWNVLAKPNGNLIDTNTNRNLYSLYYESKAIQNFEVKEDGFIVKGSEAAEFLEEKLAILGLTDREAEEFIIYWLPKLEANKYNYIRFATEEEINVNMPLEITPKPDNIIRILMTFKGLDNPISIEEQQLITPKRSGFTVVEWGGSKIE